MITGKYGKPIPPPGCIWEWKPIILYSELAEAYDKGWAVFESFTSDRLGREVTSQFTLERVWNAMGGGRRFVCEQPVNVTSPPEGLKPFPNKQMVYIGKGPLPEDKRELSTDEDPLWLYYDPILSGWDQCYYTGDTEAHHAVDPTTDYAREHWPEHVAAWERAREEERNLISQEQLRKKWQKRMGGDAIMYPSDSIITVSSFPYKDPTRVPEGVKPLPKGYTWAYFGPGPLPVDAQFTGNNHSGDKLMVCMPCASIPSFKDWKTGDYAGTQRDHHYAVNVETVYARQHFPELVKNMRIKRMLDKINEVVNESMQQYIGQRVSKELQDNMVREMTSFVPKFPGPLGCGVGSGYDFIIPNRCVGKPMFAHIPIVRTYANEEAELYGMDPEDLVIYWDGGGCGGECEFHALEEGSRGSPNLNCQNDQSRVSMSEPKQQLFNHAYDFAFEVISNDERGKDVTGSMLREACIERTKRISDEEFLEACDRFDTHREGE